MVRLNASRRPSGENAGLRSAMAGGGGDVNRRFSPVSMDTVKRPEASPGEARSETINALPSGVHVRTLLPKYVNSRPEREAVSATFRSAPPSAGTINTAERFSGSSLRNAIERPSGDQAGL